MIHEIAEALLESSQNIGEEASDYIKAAAESGRYNVKFLGKTYPVYMNFQEENIIGFEDTVIISNDKTLGYFKNQVDVSKEDEVEASKAILLTMVKYCVKLLDDEGYRILSSSVESDKNKAYIKVS